LVGAVGRLGGMRRGLVVVKGSPFEWKRKRRGEGLGGDAILVGVSVWEGWRREERGRRLDVVRLGVDREGGLELVVGSAADAILEVFVGFGRGIVRVVGGWGIVGGMM
jgi:hypothetical protein